jgi:tagaturonate reductase
MINQLSRKVLPQITKPEGISIPDDSIFNLPEKVLQFGTGVLLRALPDYFIDKANKLGIFNGRIVIVKSTAGDTELFASQDNLYTHCVRGILDGVNVEEDIINASISRVLSARSQWKEILECAANPDMQVIISNTTETGICLTNDNINSLPPESFPGKLLSFLYNRYTIFNGDTSKGMVVIPTELISDNGDKLFSIVKQLAEQNGLDTAFMEWLENSNYFCNSLVDRIVPNVLSADLQNEIENTSGYKDDLLVTSELYNLWAIEAKDRKVQEILSFQKADKGVVIEKNIEVYRELKLRLLNGSHTFNCALAHFAGFETVRLAMANVDFSNYVEQLMLGEICQAINNNNISLERAEIFSYSVLERFRNPYIDQKWLSISLHFSLKMRARNIPLIINYFNRCGRVPECMSLGFASYLLFMRGRMEEGKYYGRWNGINYLINDETAGYFSELWSRLETGELVKTVLGNIDMWGVDLNQYDGFATAIAGYIGELNKGRALEIIQKMSCFPDIDKALSKD